MKKCFKKIRLGGKKKKCEASKLINERAKLKIDFSKSLGKDRERLAKIIELNEVEILKHLEELNSKRVIKYFKYFSDTSGTCNTNGIWNLKKKYFPRKSKLSILAKKNENEKLISNPEELKSIYLKTYINRLRHRDIKPGFQNIKLLKEYLCAKRLEMTAQYKATRPTRNKLDQVLKKLKNNKARDPFGLINELFKIGAIGDDLKESLFLMCYKIRDNLEIPELLKFANITSIYKGKGAKNDLQNERGIFSINIFRSLILKLIYNDEYDNIDKNMSDSNVGGRKKMNIRNHIFIVNGIINEAVRKNKNKLGLNWAKLRSSWDWTSLQLICIE